MTTDPAARSADTDDPYGTYGHAIMHPDRKIRDKARRYVDGQLPDLPPMPGDEGNEDGRE